MVHGTKRKYGIGIVNCVVGNIVGNTDAENTNWVGNKDGKNVASEGLLDGAVVSFEVGLSVREITDEGILDVTEGWIVGSTSFDKLGVHEGTEVGYVDGFIVTIEFEFSLFHSYKGIESQSSSI